MRFIGFIVGFVRLGDLVGALRLPERKGLDVVEGVQRVLSSPSAIIHSGDEDTGTRIGWLDPSIAGGSMIDVRPIFHSYK